MKRTRKDQLGSKDELFGEGIRVRKKVLTAKFVDEQFAKADDFTMPMQMFATKAAWGMIWARPALSYKVRSMLNIAFLVALGKAEQIEVHLDGAMRNGVTKQEIQEILLQSAVYCGFPAAFNAFHTARHFFAQYEAKAGQKSPKKSRGSA